MKKTYCSPFALLGDVSQYTYQDLSTLIVDMDSKLIENHSYKVVQWSDPFTVMTIRFNEDGSFDQILREEWRELNMVFDYGG